MPSNEGTLSERVQTAFQKLSLAATALNLVSDELGRSVAELDGLLKGLNLGIASWVSVNRWGDDEGGYTIDEIGYDKVSGKWGVALRQRCGDTMDPEESVETWLFNDAPRSPRLEAVGKIPELLEKLSNEADETSKEVAKRLTAAKEVLGAC